MKIDAPTAINEMTAAVSNVVLFPNPTANQVSLVFGEVTNENISIDLLDITGTVVANLLNNQPQSSLIYTFDLNSHATAPGMYLVRIATAKGSEFKKIIKTN